jgi:hypothetical protein
MYSVEYTSRECKQSLKGCTLARVWQTEVEEMYTVQCCAYREWQTEVEEMCTP